MAAKPVNKFVFINCPFDELYKRLMEAMIFAILECGFLPICAEEKAGHIRLDKIIEMIEICEYGIHDLSRLEIDANTSLPRLNMAFELGLFLGAMRYGDEIQKNKKLLILDEKPYRFRNAISDLAGYDAVDHNNEPEKMIVRVREWLSLHLPIGTLAPGASIITEHYKNFREDVPDMCKNLSLDRDHLSFNDYVNLASRWLRMYA